MPGRESGACFLSDGGNGARQCAACSRNFDRNPLTGGGTKRMDEWLAREEREQKRKKRREKENAPQGAEQAQGRKEDYGSSGHI